MNKLIIRRLNDFMNDSSDEELLNDGIFDESSGLCFLQLKILYRISITILLGKL